MAYRAAASCREDDSSDIACIRAERTIRQILEATESIDYWLYLSGSSNFRYELYPEYKANRRDVIRPQWLQLVREFLLIEWDADVTDGYEADDALGIKSTELELIGLKPIICSLDKDLLQIAGLHYNWVKETLDTINTHDSLVNFYSQLLLGDRSDNIPGYDGMARSKPTRFLKQRIDQIVSCSSELEMYQVVKDTYTTDDLERNAQLLYIWRKELDKWQAPMV